MSEQWPDSREEELADRSRRKKIFFMAGGLVGLAGLVMLALNFTLVMAEGSPTLLLTPLPLIGAAFVFLWAGGRVSVNPDMSLPAWEELEMNDPRRAVPLSRRRQRWFLTVLCWGFGWGLGGLLVARGDLQTLGWMKPILFLLLTMGPVLLGARLLRSRNGSAAWPDR